MTKQRQTHIWVVPWALALLSFAAGKAWAQDVFASNGGGSGSTSIYQDSYSSSCDEKNHGSLAMDSPDPAICLDLPAQNGQCKTMAGENTTFEGQTGNMCHFCQENGYQELRSLAPNWIIVPNDDEGGAALAAYQQGFQCSPNPGDLCYLTCYGRGTFKPPPGTTLRTGTGTGGTPLPAPQGATPPKLPAQATSSPCLPYGPGGYDYCQNPIGTRLPAGCTCSRTPAPPPGSKGLVRVLPASPTLTPQTPKFDYADEATTPNIPAFGQAMAKCLNSELPYPVSPTILPAYLTEAQRSASQAVSSVPFAKLSPINQIFVVETAMALQAQAVHDVLYQESQYTPANATSYMVGWLERCLVSAGLRPMSYDQSPNAPWKLYAPFLNKPAGSGTPPPAETAPPPGSKGLYRSPTPGQPVPSISPATKYFAMGYTTFGAMKPLPLKVPNP